MKVINIWCDGACVPNPGTGGYAAIVLDYDDTSFVVMGYEEETTNNRMEMMAVLASLEEVEYDNIIEINLHSDSQLIVGTMSQGWGSSANLDLWDKIKKLNSKLNVNWIKVKGHSGLKYNEECDKLATLCILNKYERTKIAYDGLKNIQVDQVSTITYEDTKNQWKRVLVNSLKPEIQSASLDDFFAEDDQPMEVKCS
jgi:ribonuclease HI